MPARAVRRVAGRKASGKGHDDFADMFAAGHQPKRRVDAARRETRGYGSGRSAPCSTSSADLLEHLPGQRFVAAENRVHRDDMKRRIAPQRPERDARVLIDVAFADLDEAAELREAREPHRDRFAGERIEHHVHALASVSSMTASAKSPRRESITCFDAERLEQRAFARAARGGDDFRAEMMRDLDRRHADAARARVNEDAFAACGAAPRF